MFPNAAQRDAEAEKIEGKVIINAGRVVKLRALKAVATFHVDGRILNYKH